MPNREEVAVVPCGELDLASIATLEHEVRELLSVGFDRIVIDLRSACFLDSVGLCLLIRLNDERQDGQQLILVPGSAQVQRVFELTNTRELFEWRSPC